MELKESKSKYSFIQSALDQRKKENRFRSLVTINPSLEGPEIENEGKTLINFCSNDYLGLASHPTVIGRSRDFLNKYGAGSSSSRLISGTFSIHSDLEQKLANIFDFESALIFNSGFQGNTAILSAIADRNSLILLDKKCHNSLVQGAILSRATIKRFNHNDSEHLETILKNSETTDYNRKIIVTETVFSMDGDLNHLEDMISISNRFNALLYSDDAHAIGVLGEKGLGLNYGAEGIDLNVGTFGKSFGGFGAFVGCSNEMKDYLINFASGFIYSTALPPSVIGGIDAALDVIPTMDAERNHLFEMIDYLKAELKDDFEIADSNSQIIPVIIGDENETIELSNQLKESGLWVSAIRPPTVENGASRLRITLTVNHTKAHLKQLIKALKKAKHG